MVRLTTLAGVIACAVPVAAAAQTAPAPAPGAPAPAAPEKKICRSEGTTGSRLGSSRRCLTAAEWREMERIQRQQIDEQHRLQNNGRGPGGG